MTPLIMLRLFIALLLQQKVLSDGCGGDLEGSSGVLTFPEAGHFPEAGQREYIEYRSHQDCYWTITVDVGMTMVLQFDMIDIEDGSTCQYDYVEIFDGDIDLGKYCGSTPPDPILSFTNVATIHFHSDSTFNGEGFRVTYNATEHALGLRTCANFNDEFGSFQSLDLDADGYYENNASCLWVIISPQPTKVVQIYITDMDIPSDEHCSGDRIEILDNGETTLSVLCGTKPPPIITSNTHVLHVIFYSDESVTGRGFKAMFNVLDEDGLCGGILTEPNVTLASPDRDLDNKYDPESDCVWTLVAPEGRAVHLVILHVNMEGIAGTSCYYDKILVYDSEVTYGTVCGYAEKPQNFTSASHILHVYFHSDRSGVSFDGFEAVSYHIRQVSNDSNEVTDRTPSSEIYTEATDSDITKNQSSTSTSGLAPTTGMFWCIFCSDPAITETALNTTYPKSNTESPTFPTSITETPLNTRDPILTTESSLNTTAPKMTMETSLDKTISALTTETSVHSTVPTSDTETPIDTMDPLLTTEAPLKTTVQISTTESSLNITLPNPNTEIPFNTTVQISTTTEQVTDETTNETTNINHTTISKTLNATVTVTTNMSTTTEKSSQTKSKSSSTETDAVNNTTITSTTDGPETNRTTQDIQGTLLPTYITVTAAIETIEDFTTTLLSTPDSTIEASSAIMNTPLINVLVLLPCVYV